MNKFRLFATLLLLSLVGQLCANSTGVTTAEQLMPQLDQILKQTVAQSPRMVSRALDLEMAENDRIAARAGLLPTLSGSYRYMESREKRADQPGRLSVPKTYYDVNISQPLFHWGERRNNARIGQIQEQMTQGNYRQAYHLLAQEVRKQYFLLIMDKLRVRKADLAMVYANNQLKVGEQRLAQNAMSEADIFSVRIAAERGLIDLERAKYDQEDNKATFTRLTGLPAPADADLPDAIPAIPEQSAAMQGLLAGYLTQKDKPTIVAVNTLSTIEIERLTLANEKTRLRPKFNFVVGVSQDEQRYTTIGQKYQVNSQYAGISVNWTIFDGFSARSGVRNSLARLRQMESDYRSLDESLAQQAQSQVRLAGFNARYASINDRYMESAAGNLKAKREEFKLGVTSEDTVSGAEIGLYDSQLNAYASRADYFNMVSDFLGTIMQDPALENLPAGK